MTTESQTLTRFDLFTQHCSTSGDTEQCTTQLQTDDPGRTYTCDGRHCRRVSTHSSSPNL